MKQDNYKPLGNYIQLVDKRNRDGAICNLVGVSFEKKIIPSIANTIGTDLSNYRIIKPGQFAYCPVTSRNGERISIALYKGEETAILSVAYSVFEITKPEELDADYLMLWVSRPEFDRYARFMSHGSVRELFSWDEMCNVLLPVPSIEEQRRIVSEYQTVERRIKNNEAMIKKLEETAQAIYHHTFVDGIDENNLPEGWKKGCLGDVAEYVKERISTCDLEERQYLSTEDIEKDKKGIDKSSSTPDNTNVTAFRKGDILISNIRPYFKKIWLASFDGGCSTDVLCYRTKEKEFHKFLYYTLLEDKFFDYVVAGCKGTKMPRGDKDWNMQYPILVPSKKSLNDYSLKVKPLLNYSSSIVAETSHLRTLLSLLTSKLS